MKSNKNKFGLRVNIDKSCKQIILNAKASLMQEGKHATMETATELIIKSYKTN